MRQVLGELLHSRCRCTTLPTLVPNLIRPALLGAGDGARRAGALPRRVAGIATGASVRLVTAGISQDARLHERTGREWHLRLLLRTLFAQ